MIFYSVINNNKIVIRQLLCIRATVCVLAHDVGLVEAKEEDLGTGAACISPSFIFKGQGQRTQVSFIIPGDA